MTRIGSFKTIFDKSYTETDVNPGNTVSKWVNKDGFVVTVSLTEHSNWRYTLGIKTPNGNGARGTSVPCVVGGADQIGDAKSQAKDVLRAVSTGKIKESDLE